MSGRTRCATGTGRQHARHSEPGLCRSAIGIALGAVNGAFNLDVALSALESTGKGRVLSTPRVTTQNNVEAEIMQGVQIPVVTPATANNPRTVTYKDAALTLQGDAADHRREHGHHADQRRERAAPVRRVLATTSTIDTQRAITRVQVSDGTTTIMGGIFIATRAVDRRPDAGLYRLPLCSAGCSSATRRATRAGNC